MRAIIVISAFVALTLAQTPRQIDINDGRYYPDNSGAYNGGDDGSYHPDDSGAYRPDDSGAYRGGYEKYVHQADKFGGSGGSGGSGGGFVGGARRVGTFVVSAQPPRTGAVITGVRTAPAGGAIITGVRTAPAGGAIITGTRTGVSGGAVVTGARSGGYVATPVQGSGAGYYDNRNYAIIRKEEQVEPDGYHYVYETENKILGEEQGRLANVGSQNEAMQASGYFEYTGPDNVVYRVDYTANENGFVPSAAHLPTPPPIPEAILRSLDYQRSIGEL